MIKFLGAGGKKKPEKTPKIGKGFIPTDKVKELSAKGFAETEIIDVLRKEGFSAEEIDRALTQALKIGVTGEETEGLPTLKDLQSQPVSEYGEDFLQPQPPPMPVQPMQPPQYPTEYYPSEEYGTEELVESIVQERMEELDQKLSEFKARYSDLERKISDLHNRLSVLLKGRTKRDEEIIAKLDSFKGSLEDIEARLSSLEKTFKEALPALIESVRSLTDLVHEFKRK